MLSPPLLYLKSSKLIIAVDIPCTFGWPVPPNYELICYDWFVFWTTIACYIIVLHYSSQFIKFHTNAPLGFRCNNMEDSWGSWNNMISCKFTIASNRLIPFRYLDAKHRKYRCILIHLTELSNIFLHNYFNVSSFYEVANSANIAVSVKYFLLLTPSENIKNK